VLAFATAQAWSEWLEAHHASSRGLWLKIAKKSAGAAVGHVRGGARWCARVGVDRRAEGGVKRRLVAAALHAAHGEEPVVEDQLREGRGADRRRNDGSSWFR
jgi:hypothetical protein